MRHLLSAADLDSATAQLILDTAAELATVTDRSVKKLPTLRGRTVVNLFFEDSTRTRISFEMAQHKENGQMMGAQAIVALAGFAPPTLHSLGARVGNGLAGRVWNTVVTNVPGPQFPLYAGGARLVGAYPVVPLARNQAVSIGVTSYDGTVYYGLNADRDSMPDVDELAGALTRSLQELRGTLTRRRRPVTHSGGQAKTDRGRSKA